MNFSDNQFIESRFAELRVWQNGFFLSLKPIAL
jgi:hypothetical protein